MDFLKVLKRFFPSSRAEILASVLIIIIYALSSIFFIEIYRQFGTSPVVILPAAGIAFIAVIYGGYRMWFPIFLAQYFVSLTQNPYGILFSLIPATTYALQAVVVLFFVRRYEFEPGRTSVQNSLILIVIALLSTALAPFAITFARMYLDLLVVTPILNFTRSWGGGVFSALMLMPLAMSWYPLPSRAFFHRNFLQWLELGASFALLLGINYMLFWTTYPRIFGISVIFFLPAVLIWLALRQHPRWMTLGLFISAIIGVAGTLLTYSGSVGVGQQLLNVEIYLGFVAAIFLLFSAVVHERQKAYEDLTRAYVSTSASDQGKNEFIAILAHELRNPLAPVVSSLETLKLQLKDPDNLKLVTDIEGNISMVRRLLDDLLDSVRVSQGRFKLQKETVDLRHIVQASVSAVSDFATSRNQKIMTSLPDGPVNLSLDSVRARQIVMNILNNACKYTDPGGRIELLVESRGEHAVVQISDTGIGIDPRVISKLFHPFRQIRQTSEQGTGLGIGLYLTKRLTEMHGGKLTVESAGAGKGSTFTVYLPVPLQNELPGMHTKRRTPHAAESSRVLVVDDNRSAADALQKLLRLHGHEVAVAYSGKDALTLFERFDPHLILLDVGMPDMSGYEVAAEMRARRWAGTIAILSGYGQEEDRIRSREVGVDHHFVKPVEVDDILKILRGNNEE